MRSDWTRSSASAMKPNSSPSAVHPMGAPPALDRRQRVQVDIAAGSWPTRDEIAATRDCEFVRVSPQWPRRSGWWKLEP